MEPLSEQEHLSISGSSARHMVMRKLLRKQEVRPGWTGGQGSLTLVTPDLRVLLDAARASSVGVAFVHATRVGRVE